MEVNYASITKQNSVESCRHLAPKRIREAIAAGEILGIAAIEEDYPVAILCFGVDPFQPKAAIRWIFVEQDCRNQGVGTGLFNYTRGILEKSGIRRLSYQFDGDINDIALDEFLNEKCSITGVRSVRVFDHMAFEMQNCSKLNRLSGNHRIHDFSRVTNVTWEQIAQKLSKSSQEYAIFSLVRHRKNVNEALSSIALAQDGSVDGFLLVQDSSINEVNPVLLIVLKKDNPMLAIELLAHTYEVLMGSFSKRIRVRIVCMKAETERLAENLFRDLSLQNMTEVGVSLGEG